MGVRHALFPVPTLGASSREGCRLPDAIFHGKRNFRPRSRAVAGIAAAQFRVRLFSLLRLVVAPPACEPGKDTPVTSSRLHHLAQGQRQLLAVRSPCATGLASSLSGCFSLTGQRCLFRHRRLGGRFSRVLPRHRALPGSKLLLSRLSASFAWRRLACWAEASARVFRSVLVRSNNRLPFGQLRFTQRPKPPLHYFTRLAAASHRCSSLGFHFA